MEGGDDIDSHDLDMNIVKTTVFKSTWNTITLRKMFHKGPHKEQI